MGNTRVIDPNNQNPNEFSPRVSRLQQNAFNELASTPAVVPVFQKTVDLLVTDVSGSTNGLTGSKRASVKHEAIKSACSAFASQLPPQSQVAIVAFSSNAELVLPLTYATDKLAIISKIHSLPQPNGTTQLIQALLMAERELAKAREGLKRVFVMTDGLFSDQPMDVAMRLQSMGIEITTIAFGMDDDVDESALAALASIGPDGRPLHKNFNELAALSNFLKISSRVIA